MNKFFITIATLLLLYSVTGCAPETEYHVKRTEMLPITEYNLPDTVMVADTIMFQAHTEAPNECYKELFFEFGEINDTVHTLAAYGLFESFGTCPQALVTKDTTIQLIPERKGKYMFYIGETAFRTVVDSVFVDSLEN